MGVVTRTAEARSSKMTAAQLYKNMFIDMDKVMPKILPQIFKSVRLVEGDGGVGTVKEITYGEAVKATTMIQKLVEMDPEAMTYTKVIIGGDVLMGTLESVAYHSVVESSDSGECVVKLTVVFTPLAGQEVSEDYIKDSIAQSYQTFYAVEAHVQATY
ncbi:hypothetical protein ACET3Z_002223 [Daucus carota]